MTTIRHGQSDQAWVGAAERVHPEDTAQVAAILADAHRRGLAVVPTGAGTKLTWGAPPRRCDILLDLSRLTEVVEHGVGEYVVVAGAGLRLSTLQTRLAEAGQQLALDPARDGTLGGIVATGDNGPARLLYGAPRDLVIGATMVRADGVIAKSGGKVVKNVAGYDLGKLLTGSYGTLAVLTTLAFRLHPVPQARRWISVAETDPRRLAELSQALIHSTVVPAALEVTRAVPSGPAGTRSGELAVCVVGVEAGVAGCAQEAARLLGSTARLADEPPPWWRATPGAPGEPLVKLTFPLSRIEAALAAVDAAAADAGVAVAVRASTGVGVAWVEAPGAEPEQVVRLVRRMRDAATAYEGGVVLLDGPAAAKAGVDVWGPVHGLELMRAVKDRFDPAGVLAPGRFVGGI